MQPEKEMMNPFQIDIFTCFIYRPWGRLTTIESTFLAYLSRLGHENRNISLEEKGVPYASLLSIEFYRYDIKNKPKRNIKKEV